jgi:uncharacterized membrane protein
MSARSQWLQLLRLATLAFFCLGHDEGGCGKESEPEPEPHHHEGGASGATCPQSGGPTEQTFGRAFLESYCLSCHGASVTGPARGGAPEDMNFDTLEEVREHAEHMDTHAAAGPSATNTDMPPSSSPQPTQEERRKLGEWLACGAP